MSSYIFFISDSNPLKTDKTRINEAVPTVIPINDMKVIIFIAVLFFFEKR